MSKMNDGINRARAVLWPKLTRWSVHGTQAGEWHWPASDIKPLSHAFERRSEAVDRSLTPPSPEHFITIRFSGEIAQRETGNRQPLKGALYVARPGDVVYSKIDVRNGAIAVIPKDKPLVMVTSEFPVYRIKPDVALPEYVKLLVRSAKFLSIIKRMTSGASGRKRVQPAQLENLLVPLPAIEVQALIVARWNERQVELEEVDREIGLEAKSANAECLEKLGLTDPASIRPTKVFGVLSPRLRRWGVRFNQLALGGADLEDGQYPIAILDSVLDLVQYGTSAKANSVGKGTAVLRMGNIKSGVIDTTDLKHVPLGDKTLKGLVLQRGDVLMIRTNGSRDLVGTTAVFEGEGEFVFASYLIRLRFKDEIIPQYASWFLNSAFGRQQIDAISRQIMQNNINSEEIRSLRLPVPPRSVQEQIVARLEHARTTVKRLRAVATARGEEVVSEVENLLLRGPGRVPHARSA